MQHVYGAKVLLFFEMCKKKVKLICVYKKIVVPLRRKGLTIPKTAMQTDDKHQPNEAPITRDMKRFSILLLAALASCTMSLNAVTHCYSSSWGFAGTEVTGGGDAAPILVSDYNALKNALTNNTGRPKVVIITQDIEFHKKIVSGISNLTLLALPGVRLITNETEPANSGLLHFQGGRNIILRNLTFEGAGIYNRDGKDCLEANGVYHMWVDHCDFSDGMDGNFDIDAGADSITVTWCRFRYFGDPTLSDEHRYSNLIGSLGLPADSIYNITYAFCWWDEGCRQRMPKACFCVTHILNCYWNSSTSRDYIGSDNASCYVEGGMFEGRANDRNLVWMAYSEGANYCTFVNCAGNIPADEGVVAPPDYEYDHLSPAESKALVTDPSCGAGATLMVTTSGTVFSTCDPLSGTGQYPSAENAIFYWQMAGTSIPDIGTTLPAQGGEVYVGSTDASKAYNVESAAYASGVPDMMQARNGKGLKATNSFHYLVIKPDTGSFHIGDTLFICGYNPWKVSTSLNTQDLIDSVQTGTSKTDYNIGYLLLPFDADSLVLTRGTNTSSGIAAIAVCRWAPTPYEEPLDTILHSVMWSMSDADFISLDTIKALTSVRQLHLVATPKATMIVDASKKNTDGYSFTHRLKTGGQGAENSRHLRMDVKGDCVIDFYVASASGTDQRTLTIATGTFDNIAGNVPAVAGNPAKQTYRYFGNAGRLYLYGTEGGINIYAIKLTYPGEEEGIDLVSGTNSVIPCKFLRNGQLYILRGEKVYTLDGQLVK